MKQEEELNEPCKHMKALEYNGFTPFEIDDTTLYSKEFPEIGYTLCTSDDDTFTISRYDDGHILARFHIDNIESVNNAFSRANEEINKFKFDIKQAVDMLVNEINKGGKNV